MDLGVFGVSVLGDSFATPLSSFFGVTVFFGLFLVSLTGVSGIAVVVLDMAAAATLTASLQAGVVFGILSGVCEG